MRKKEMNIVIINGQNHKGSTYHIGRMLAERVGGDIAEFFLPRDFSDYCVGCSQCFEVAAEKCPHYEAQQPILKAMDAADLIILTSPVYVYHASAPMKNFLDHQGHRWLVHRPKAEMFTKQAVCISTAAGAGMKSTNKDMADSLFFWGVPKIYEMGFAVRAINWNGVTDKTRVKIDRQVDKVARQIRSHYGNAKPGLKTKAWFYAMRMVQSKFGWCAPDVKYWNEMGWTKKVRPWKGL
mgnify:FL=1